MRKLTASQKRSAALGIVTELAEKLHRLNQKHEMSYVLHDLGYSDLEQAELIEVLTMMGLPESQQ